MEDPTFMERGVTWCLQQRRLLAVPSLSCWAYSPRPQKGLIPFDSAQSKAVKRAIASSYLCVVAKLSQHKLAVGVIGQITRFWKSCVSRGCFPGCSKKRLEKVLKRGAEAKEKEQLKSAASSSEARRAESDLIGTMLHQTTLGDSVLRDVCCHS